MKKDNKICKTCKHWKNNQAELDYSPFDGICTCIKWRFTTTNNSDIKLLDRENRSPKHMGVQRFENQNNEIPVGQPERSRYCLVTSDEFGCIHHTLK